jgi:phosphoglycerate dehydrogenase-like enzyme
MIAPTCPTQLWRSRNAKRRAPNAKRILAPRISTGILPGSLDPNEMQGLSIWTNLQFTDQAAEYLIEGTKNHQLIIVPPGDDVLQVGVADPRLKESDIAFGQPNPEDLVYSSRLRWAHISSAGYTRYDTPNIRAAFAKRQVPLTNSSGVFSEPCAQHALGWLLAEARQFYPAFQTQLTDRAWRQNEVRSRCRLLGDQTIVIVGFGSIGRRLAELLKPFSARVFGYRRNPVPDQFAEVIGPDRLDTILGEADHVVNTLPAGPESDGFFDAARFACIKSGACYYAIGRGTTTDQHALQRALSSGHLAAAYLDVMDPEPLPPDHELWRLPNCYITPHSSGGHVNESFRLTKHFVENLRRFETGTPLRDRVF